MAAAMERGILEAAGLMASPAPDERKPFENKYRAREILKGLLGMLGDSGPTEEEEKAKAIVRNLFEKMGEKAPDEHKLRGPEGEGAERMDERKRNWLGRLHHLMGVNYCETEEASQSKEHLRRAVKYLTPDRLKHPAELVECYNYMSINASNRTDFQKAKELCESGVSLYKDAKSEGKTEGDAKRARELEDAHTLTLFYLAQVEGHLGNGPMSARYLLLTMARQLDGAKDFNPKEFVNNAITIAGFHLNSARYRQADHCLKAAEHVLQTRWKANERDNEEKEEALANIQRTWGALHLHRLRAEEPDQKCEKVFANLDLDPSPEYERCIEYKTSRKAFLAGKKVMEEAAAFFVLDGFVTDHIKILQELSQFWKLLAMREADPTRRARMHKRRINLLRPVLHEISQAAYGQEYQQLADEVASSYVKIFDCKEQIFPSVSTAKRPKAVAKMNSLLQNAILYYRVFMRGFHENFGPDPPAKMDGYLQPPYLQARFHVARLLAKIVADSIPAKCKLDTASYEEYKEIVKLCERYDCKEFVEELKICKEMVDLLPAKIKNWQRRAANGEV
eukprot:CAMPEP_0114516848 /NCGR_PEP_ID=MMETSP0109-20121206/17560_1 /TAXON_ID=29199 /ORGANISM="Chlorarachnion reptans, Strain CCCM449" /LENGTH=563 /DNA_ID=CAMNT_0001697291 /DNA_START=144 /DNA_END=1835 /DNA_ORIENTATION=+